MSPDRFVADAMRTKSDIYRPDITSFHNLEACMTCAVSCGQNARLLKRALFGGRIDPTVTLDSIANELHTCSVDRLPNRDMLHAMLGLINESGELASMLLGVLQGRHSFNRVNYVEELGDMLWFIALACDAEGLSLQRVMAMNIAKLRARFPDKFDAEKMDDANRDTSAEHAAFDEVNITHPHSPTDAAEAAEHAAFNAATEEFGRTVTAYKALIAVEPDPERRATLERLLSNCYDDNA